MSACTQACTSPSHHYLTEPSVMSSSLGGPVQVAVQKPGKSHQLVFEAFIGMATGVDLRNVHYAPVGADLVRVVTLNAP